MGVGANAAPPLADGVHVRQITYTYRDTRYVEQMYFSDQALAALRASPVERGEKGERLIEDLEQRGAVLQDVRKPDGTLVPSEQDFYLPTGKRICVVYRTAGQQQDPSPGVASVQAVDVKTGQPSYIYYFQNGEKQDPAPGQPARSCVNAAGKLLFRGHYLNDKLEDVGDEPAYEEFDPVTGRLTGLIWCHNGLCQDPADGEPAQQNFDGKTGALISAARCTAGQTTHKLDASELAALAAKKSGGDSSPSSSSPDGGSLQAK
jgi:hypothetical protein